MKHKTVFHSFVLELAATTSSPSADQTGTKLQVAAVWALSPAMAVCLGKGRFVRKHWPLQPFLLPPEPVTLLAAQCIFRFLQLARAQPEAGRFAEQQEHNAQILAAKFVGTYSSSSASRRGFLAGASDAVDGASASEYMAALPLPHKILDLDTTMFY